MGKFRQCLTELSACNTIMAGYYSLSFYFLCFYTKNSTSCKYSLELAYLGIFISPEHKAQGELLW